MKADICMILCACPDKQVAISISHSLAEQALVACAHISSPITSIYSWAGEIKASEEVMLTMKTRSFHLPAVSALIEKLHPYDCPEIISFDINGGSNAYLEWVYASTT